MIGANDFLDKLRLWAVSKGWTQEEWSSGYIWDQSSHWVADARGRFLILSKSGYGSQNLIASFATVLRDSSPYCTMFGFIGGMRSQVAYTEDTQEHPVGQNKICGLTRNLYYNYYSAGFQASCGFDLGESYTIPKVWFFAGTHWIAAVAQMNDVYCQWLHFGSCEIFENNPSQGQCFGVSGNQFIIPGDNYDYGWHWDGYKSLGTNKWVSAGFLSYEGIYSYNRRVGFDMWYGSRSFYQTDSTQVQYCKNSIQFPNAAMGTTHFPMLNIVDALKPNYFSAKRPLIKPIYSYQRSSDSVYVPIARAPYYACSTAGLEIGQQLDMDGASYLVFPEPTIYNSHGWAFCINDGTTTTTTV